MTAQHTPWGEGPLTRSRLLILCTCPLPASAGRGRSDTHRARDDNYSAASLCGAGRTQRSTGCLAARVSSSRRRGE
jgi:hypothetical protein